jgi:hypothetical protein
MLRNLPGMLSQNEILSWNERRFPQGRRRRQMLPGFIMWLIGVPLVVIVLLYLIF